MSKTEVHVVPSPESGWRVKSGKEQLAPTFRTKAEAVAAARDWARQRKAELVVHNKDGRIAWKNSYGNDPRRSKG